MWKYIFSVVVCLGLSASLLAQSRDSTQVKEKADWAPSALRIGTEVTGPLFGLFDDDYSQWELTADMDFHKYFIVADFGYESRIREGETFRFDTKGHYWRAGLDVNFLTRDQSRSVLFFGLRYAGSSFSGDLRFDAADTLVFGEDVINYSFEDYTARWGEAVLGLKAQVLKNIYLGITGRFQFAISIDGELAVSAYEVPGFGVADDNSSFALDYYIYYRIPWRQKPIPPKKK